MCFTLHVLDVVVPTMSNIILSHIAKSVTSGSIVPATPGTQ